jgi:hypothetical protein
VVPARWAGAAPDKEDFVSRLLAVAFAVAMAALAFGLLLGGIGAAPWLAGLMVIIAGILLSGVVIGIFAMAWRTKGWSVHNRDEPDWPGPRR